MGLSGRTAGEVQPGWVGISPEGSSWTESEGRAVGVRHGRPRLPRGFGLSGLQDRTRLPGLYPKAFRTPSLRELSRFGSQGLGYDGFRVGVSGIVNEVAELVEVVVDRPFALEVGGCL